jgi:YHS domain-containing protein
MAKDPVCGMTIDEEKAAVRSEYQGRTYYFCVLGCKVAFEKDPEKYLQGKEKHHGMHGMLTNRVLPRSLPHQPREPSRSTVGRGRIQVVRPRS